MQINSVSSYQNTRIVHKQERGIQKQQDIDAFNCVAPLSQVMSWARYIWGIDIIVPAVLSWGKESAFEAKEEIQ